MVCSPIGKAAPYSGVLTDGWLTGPSAAEQVSVPLGRLWEKPPMRKVCSGFGQVERREAQQVERDVGEERISREHAQEV
jgi:hypothetical protein